MLTRLLLLLAVTSALVSRAQMFILPTPNRALLTDGALSEKYLVGTIGKPWPSGGFGCVRSEGLKMHEGLDIRATQRDKQGESIDPVVASADGAVVYLSNKPGLSNYGRYIVLRHNIEGVQICTLYAHLRDIQDGLAIGQQVKQGQRIGTLGRSTNTREGISKDRAHLHFEISFALTDNYSEWHKKYRVGQRNDHGDWNGQNLAAIDPTPILLGAAREGANFSLVKHLQSRREYFRVVVRDTNFPFLRNNPGLVKPNPTATANGIAAYDIALDFNGAPIELIPRAATELKSMSRVRLYGINDAEVSKHRCAKLLTTRKGRRELSYTGEQRVNLLTY
jgi:murein DD-endopeptidase MepM/ murein hydrolase activator NlpD